MDFSLPKSHLSEKSLPKCTCGLELFREGKKMEPEGTYYNLTGVKTQ